MVLRNTPNETLINEDYNEELSKEYEKPKSNKFKYGLGIFLLLCAVITILFYFNKFQIIDLNFNQIIDLNFDKIKSSIFSLKILFLSSYFFIQIQIIFFFNFYFATKFN